MSRASLEPECRLWQAGDVTKHPPHDEAFLSAISSAGFVPFTGPSGLFGGKTAERTVVVVHRGRGKKWELMFREHEHDVVGTTSTNLNEATLIVLTWLKGEPLLVPEDALRVAS